MHPEFLVTGERNFVTRILETPLVSIMVQPKPCIRKAWVYLSSRPFIRRNKSDTFTLKFVCDVGD